MILEGHGKNEKAPVMEAFSFFDFQLSQPEPSFIQALHDAFQRL